MAAENQRIRVQLTISIDDLPLRDRVTSYFTRELRAIGDLDVSEQELDFTAYKVTILGRVITDARGSRLGYALSFLATRPMYMPTRVLLASKVNKPFADWLAGYERPELHGIYTGPEDEVKAQCQEMVAALDTRVLQPHRDSLLERHQK